MNDEGNTVEGIAGIALALSDPIRVRILDILASGREEACCSPPNEESPGAICSCDLQPRLGLQPSRLSYHLKELRKAGLIRELKKGRWIYYSLDDAALSAFAAALLGRYSPRGEGCRLGSGGSGPGSGPDSGGCGGA